MCYGTGECPGPFRPPTPPPGWRPPFFFRARLLGRAVPGEVLLGGGVGVGGVMSRTRYDYRRKRPGFREEEMSDGSFDDASIDSFVVADEDDVSEGESEGESESDEVARPGDEEGGRSPALATGGEGEGAAGPSGAGVSGGGRAQEALLRCFRGPEQQRRGGRGGRPRWWSAQERRGGYLPGAQPQPLAARVAFLVAQGAPGGNQRRRAGEARRHLREEGAAARGPADAGSKDAASLTESPAQRQQQQGQPTGGRGQRRPQGGQRRPQRGQRRPQGGLGRAAGHALRPSRAGR